jgi:putative lipoprotein
MGASDPGPPEQENRIMRFSLQRGAATLLAVLGLGAGAMADTITGTATYRERIAIPPGAMLEVILLDVSLADVAAKEIATGTFEIDGVPAPFEIAFDPARIEDRLTYSVAATITVDGEVWFRTTDVYPVLTRGNGTEVDLVLQMMRRMQDDQSGLTAMLGEWQVAELNGEVLDADPPVTVNFAEDSSIAVFAGCNRFFGGIEFEGEAISFPPAFGGSLMACPEPIATLEQTVMATIPTAERYRFEDGLLVFTDAAGAVVMRLQRP